ncbi:magnesium transporter [Aeromonas hydrophila]|nr:magnesium transporter [Aeromonas hydrophila]QBX74294.1 magnesium transporter [Aeromonas hydrophila]
MSLVSYGVCQPDHRIQEFCFMSLPAKNSAKQREQDRSRILTLLLADDALTDSLLDPQEVQDAALQDQTRELTRLVNSLPAADIADALESLPPDERHALWQQVDPERHGQILVEASETVWDSLISDMSDKELLHALRSLDIDDQIYLGQYLPRNLMGRLLTSMAPAQRDRVREVIRYGKHTVGAMMDFELITVRAEVSLATVQRYLRLRGKIPANTDKLFVTDRRNRLQGELPLTTVLLHKPETLVRDVMEKDPVTFDPEDNDEAAARTFERDDLVSAAVIDGRGKLMGRLTVAEVVDLVYEESDTDLRRMGGISEEEDVFAPVSKAVKTRWAWLAINLCTAFVASRVIGLFEHTISQLVALAALMPIVAGIGGNTGNQTITMIVRALALQHIQTGNVSFLLWRELGVALINGLVWGGTMGVATYILYQDAALGAVMTLAMMLNLLVAALMGVIIPMTMSRLGRDPAVGASVMITAITDTGGFFIFLGLATLFLL